MIQYCIVHSSERFKFERFRTCALGSSDLLFPVFGSPVPRLVFNRRICVPFYIVLPSNLDPLPLDLNPPSPKPC